VAKTLRPLNIRKITNAEKRVDVAEAAIAKKSGSTGFSFKNPMGSWGTGARAPAAAAADLRAAAASAPASRFPGFVNPFSAKAPVAPVNPFLE
jgi:hypothetical protein